MGVIWGKREGEYFWGRGWTGEIGLIGLRKLVFLAQRTVALIEQRL